MEVALAVGMFLADTSMSGVVAAFLELWTSMFTVVVGILLPADGNLTPLSVIMWAGFLTPILFIVIRFIKSLISGG